MAHFEKPAEGTWTEHYDLGTAAVTYEDSISPEHYELEREAIFKRTWLNVGRVEQVPRAGSYFTKELDAAGTSVVVVKGGDGEVRAFHNICRHRGNKLVWNDYPREETSGTCRQFTCKYHGWRYDLEGAITFVQQEQEFFETDWSKWGLAAVQCEVWLGFIWVNLDPDNTVSAKEYLGELGAGLEGYPFEEHDPGLQVPGRDREQLEALHRRLRRVLPRTDPAREPGHGRGVAEALGLRLRGARLRDRRSPQHGVVVGRHVAAQGHQHGQAHRAGAATAACSARGSAPTSRGSRTCRRR